MNGYAAAQEQAKRQGKCDFNAQTIGSPWELHRNNANGRRCFDPPKPGRRTSLDENLCGANSMMRDALTGASHFTGRPTTRKPSGANVVLPKPAVL